MFPRTSAANTARSLATLDDVFKRGSKASDSAASGDDAGALKVEPVGRVSPAKGKATPKRREAEARRRTTVVEQAGGRGGRRETRQQYAQRRAAMQRGDENALPSRDRGPVRRFARDFVDSRRTVLGYFLPVGVPIMVLSLLPLTQVIAQLALWVFFFAVAIDSMLMVRKLRREVTTRFPDESTRGLGMYALSRASMMRRLRLPKPRVERGDKI